MKRTSISALFFFALAVALFFGAGALAAEDEVALSVPAAPVPFIIKGKRALAYELYIKAPCGRSIEILSVEAIDVGKGKKQLSSMQGNDLKKHLRKPDKAVGGYVAFMWATLEAEAKLPKAIVHRVRYSDGEAEKSVEGGSVAVSSAKPARIDPPLRGSGWIAANGPSNDDMHHRVSVLSVNGSPYIGQRFGVDWMKFGDDGKIFRNNGKLNADWPCYGAELLAVADGSVADVRDGIPENRPLAKERAVPMTVGTLGGNYVVLKIGEKRHAFYAHIIPGSIRVKVGDSVKKGDVLGLLGNSGNSDAPHLHFHICEGMDFLFSEGLPYELNSYALEGRAENLEELFEKRIPWKPAAPAASVTGELMSDRDVVRFGSGDTTLN